MNPIIIVSFITYVHCFPLDWVKTFAENAQFEKFDNYLPKYDTFPKFHYSTFGDNGETNQILQDKIQFKTHGKDSPKSLKDVVDFVGEGAAAGIDLFNEVKDLFVSSTIGPETTTEEVGTNTTIMSTEMTTQELTTIAPLHSKDQLEDLLVDVFDNSTSNRTLRQEMENGIEDLDNSEETSSEAPTHGNQAPDEEESSEEDTNMITGLISSLLGGLSKPDGSIDIEAITGLLGSLSVQNDDGSYDFNGLTDLLMSFFGGNDEDGGGSNFGAFIGGIAGAFIKGIANPPGAKGVGSFLGNLVKTVLPALSAPAPAEGDADDAKPAPPPDSGGFVGGLLSSLFGGVGGLSNSSGGGAGGSGGSKFSLFKAIFSIFTSIFQSSSAPH